MVFGGNEFLACSVLHPSCFLLYISLIGFKVGGVNVEKGGGVVAYIKPDC